ncbi:recombinase family protein [Bradyrhizobium sp. UFLA05-109]
MQRALEIPQVPSRGSRAAQYIRMSTDHQKYSPENQRKVIASYALERGLTIVRTYFDEGRSGLTIAGRDDLQKLIADVQQGRADFDCVLVYDISRWGRFQDIDESAFYEFTCRRAGIGVHYCAEDFENDGSLASILHKCVSRISAAKFSRDLSKRIFIAQCHITELGYWRGGAACYGMRRQLLDERGNPKMVLEYGQHKYLQSDRIILRPGPTAEIETVRDIFRSFVTEKKTITEIADGLNNQQVPTSRGARWDANKVHKLLTNEAYIGNIVYNRYSYKLQTTAVANPPEMWIRRDNAFDGIIAPSVFEKAQQIIAKRQHRLTDQEVLDKLKALWKRKGHLSHKIITAAKNVPDTSTYNARFGSLTAAYRLIGFKPKPRYRWLEIEHRMRKVIAGAIDEIISTIGGLGGKATYDSRSHLLSIGTSFVVSIGSARCVCEGRGKQPRWRVRVDRLARSELTLLFRMETHNDKVRDYYLIPTEILAASRVKRLRISSRVFSKSNRCDTLNAFYAICKSHA